MLSQFLNIQQIALEIEAKQKAENAFQAMLKELPLEQQKKLIQQRMEMEKQLEKERKEERRHRELCDAIKGSKPSGIGIFR
jgi:hypothetical protein